MVTYLKLLVFVISFFLFILTNTFGQGNLDDSQMRERAAGRISQAHGINVDWRNTSLPDILDIESRLNTVARIKRNHVVTFDWRKMSLLELIDVEARLNTVKRIKMNHGVTFDWETNSLLLLNDAEARMNTARRIQLAAKKPINWKEHSLENLLRIETGLKPGSENSVITTLSFDVLFPPANQQAMGLHKLTSTEKQELRKHVEALMVIAVQVAGQKRVLGINMPQSARRGVQKKFYAATNDGHWIKENVDSGSTMILEDGSIWEIDPSDRIDTILWLPVSDITVLESEGGSPGYDYLLINTDDGEKSHAKYIGSK